MMRIVHESGQPSVDRDERCLTGSLAPEKHHERERYCQPLLNFAPMLTDQEKSLEMRSKQTAIGARSAVCLSS